MGSCTCGTPSRRRSLVLPLTELPVLVVDCQATLAAPRGHLIEIGWARAGPGTSGAPIAGASRLVRLPEGERVPAAVTRITGITDDLLAAGVAAEEAWRDLMHDSAALSPNATPAVAHFARFERPFLERLAGGALPLEMVCTHEIAVRLFPDLPRRGLRALAGYFGGSVGALRRSTEHVAATGLVWRELAALLGERGVRSWDDLREWLAEPVSRRERAKRRWPMPRDVRLGLPDRPGVYRMLRTSGDVLYVGKAASLRTRVNSYFQKQTGIPERMLEMLSQARGISYVEAATPLEAALLESDEIKRRDPPYNEALRETGRAVWFARADLTGRSVQAGEGRAVGPFPSASLLERLDALMERAPAALAPERWGPSKAVFEEGVALLCRSHRELGGRIERRGLLVLGARLWREGRRLGDGDNGGSEDGPLFATEWTAVKVAAEIEELAVQLTHAVRRARWITALVEATVMFREGPAGGGRLLVVRDGEIVRAEDVDGDAVPPVPEFYWRGRTERQEGFTVARLDRLRVLTTEIKRVVGKGAVCVRLAPRGMLSGERLRRVLGWL